MAIAALRMALRRSPTDGLVHHSDRGIQHVSKDYTDLLKEYHVAISMSRKGNPYDNATCESFLKTLKYEEVYRQEYRDLGQVHSAEGWEELLLPEIDRQRRMGKEVALRADAAFARPEVYEAVEERGVKYAICIPANDTLQ